YVVDGRRRVGPDLLRQRHATAIAEQAVIAFDVDDDGVHLGRGEDYRQEMYRLLATTEVNAVVIDVEGDYGLRSQRRSVPLAEQIGANSAPTIDDVDGLLQNLHQHGAYAIARIVVFKDNILARNGPRAGIDVGVHDRRAGGVWSD